MPEIPHIVIELSKLSRHDQRISHFWDDDDDDDGGGKRVKYFNIVRRSNQPTSERVYSVRNVFIIYGNWRRTFVCHVKREKFLNFNRFIWILISNGISVTGGIKIPMLTHSIGGELFRCFPIRIRFQIERERYMCE